MADVVLGRAGDTVLVDLDVCAKTGHTTSQRVTLRGSTTPGWVIVLLAFTVVGFLLVCAMTSRRSRVTLPLDHGVYARWKRNGIVAWSVALGGVGALVAAATDYRGETEVWGGVGIGMVVAALVGGTVNSTVNGLGFGMTRHDDLVLTRAHPAFAQAVAQAAVEPALR
ncbi:hypothetical protein [Aeromicrobium sp.]|uniref:hypothetical protein n=1 Tax=Aeromicrobium sp. TaxID=1871063 RepID=UPI0019CB59AD|nr:hypothetical protein [Aeromicrobium sp.]MBC7631372.1 hypothetical protein [Aeromicrobium sp.]